MNNIVLGGFWLFLAAIDLAMATANFQYHHSLNTFAEWFAGTIGVAIGIAGLQMMFTGHCWFDWVFGR